LLRYTTYIQSSVPPLVPITALPKAASEYSNPTAADPSASAGKLPLFERKALLKNKALLTKTIDRTDIQFGESLEVDGANVRARTARGGLEDVLSKVPLRLGRERKGAVHLRQRESKGAIA
jgi:hypothetical protein